MAKNKLSNFDFNKYFSSVSARTKKNVGYKKKRRIIFGAVSFLALVLIIYIISGLPSLEELENPRPQLASKVFTVDGELLGQFYLKTESNHFDSLPKYLVNALISTEDKGFYDHELICQDL
jgi:penicillin-binding protein 1A